MSTRQSWAAHKRVFRCVRLCMVWWYLCSRSLHTKRTYTHTRIALKLIHIEISRRTYTQLERTTIYKKHPAKIGNGRVLLSNKLFLSSLSGLTSVRDDNAPFCAAC